MHLSEAAQAFIARRGNYPTAEDDYGADLVAYLAGRHGRERDGNLLSMAYALRHGYAPDHDSTGCCLGALHEAVDNLHWAMADELLRHPIKRNHLLTALGTLLSHCEFYGYANRASRKTHEYALRLIQRLDGLTQEECRHMLKQAFNGSALSFYLPLMLSGTTIAPKEEWGANSAWEWDSPPVDENEKGTFANLLRRFYSESLPRLLEQYRHHFRDFSVHNDKLYFTGNPAARLPMRHVRRPRRCLKNLERAALLFALP